MAAGPWQVYEVALDKIHKGDIDLNDDTLGVMLLVDGHVVNLATHQFVNDVVANECGDTDYSRLPIASNAVAPSGGESIFTAEDFDFAPGDNATIAARYAVIYRNVGPDNDATSEVLYVVDLNTGGGNLSSTNGNFLISQNINGIHKLVPNQ